MPKTEKEKAENLSRRFKRILLIGNLKRSSIGFQDYEFAAQLRDIERKLETDHDFDNEIATLNIIYDKLTIIYNDMREGDSKDYLNSILREHKIDQILKNPSN